MRELDLVYLADEMLAFWSFSLFKHLAIVWLPSNSAVTMSFMNLSWKITDPVFPDFHPTVSNVLILALSVRTLVCPLQKGC